RFRMRHRSNPYGAASEATRSARTEANITCLRLLISFPCELVCGLHHHRRTPAPRRQGRICSIARQQPSVYPDIYILRTIARTGGSLTRQVEYTTSRMQVKRLTDDLSRV